MDDYPVKLGAMLYTLVDPERGHEVAYNRWYERDHFYGGCMIGPGIQMATNGGPGKDTSILVYKVYYDGFKAMDINGSAAQSVILMLIVIALTVIQFKFVEKKVHY